MIPNEEAQEQDLIRSSLDCYTGVVVGILTIILAVLASKRKRAPSPDPSVKIAPCGLFEGMKRLAGTDSPSFLLEMAEKCNDDIYLLRIPTFKHGGMFVVGDPKAAREILLDDDSDKPAEIYQPFENLTHGKSMFTMTSKDAMWHHSRKGAAPAFSSSEVKRMADICKQNLLSWMTNILDPCIAKNETFDPSEEMKRVIFLSIMEVAFEYKDTTYSEYETISGAIELCLREFGFKEVSNPLRKVFGFLIPSRHRAQQEAKVLKNFLSKVMNTYRENNDKSPNNTIIKLVVNNPAYKNDDERLSDLIALMIGGHDTTSFQIASILMMLSKHPQVADKLRKELAGLDEAEWSKSVYLRCIIREGIRVVPVAATGSSRTIGKEFVFRQGSIVIPKDAIVYMPQILPFHNGDIFPNPNTFDPDRWAKTTQTSNDAATAFTPFSVGKRNCIGQRLATTLLDNFIPMLLSKYKFEVVEEGEVIYFLTMKYDGARLKAMKVA